MTEPRQERTGTDERGAGGEEPQRITSTEALKALAHPIRFALLNELHARGAARAADLAEALDQPANSLSFHLRQLARYGFIVEAPERARDRRDRWWKPASEHGYSYNPKELGSTPAGRAVVDQSLRMAQQRYEAVLRRFFGLASQTEEAPEGTDVANFDIPLRLTLEEKQQLGRELDEVFDRWHRHGLERTDAGDVAGRHGYLSIGVTVPWSSAEETAARSDPARSDPARSDPGH
ncbi:MAG TPA: helix-turn-helix domain-containing protein [Segeticoccus sp.]|uniref:winged helix-turn-helix domain-containing protein n=1 Tax=Segeticoccus sp. TaxID=2706531 RepID=UPI002D810781|nr:helix-turn-helix domain-containing protein [Segeticoccus sp.]HET8600888.1 helix-turn-helix domain-containing protein [Segeticoccus sp.]